MVISGVKFEVLNIISKITNNFQVSECGPFDFILGIKINKSPNNNSISYSISQSAFINDILDRFNISFTKTVHIPCSGNNSQALNVKPLVLTKVLLAPLFFLPVPVLIFLFLFIKRPVIVNHPLFRIGKRLPTYLDIFPLPKIIVLNLMAQEIFQLLLMQILAGTLKTENPHQASLF